MKSLAIICPVHNEGESVDYFYERLTAVLDGVASDLSCQILFVNNASTDDTLQRILELRSKDRRVQIISQTRNFGYQSSVVCGLRECTADAYAIIDADCEDPPELIAQFVQHWREGYDIVYGLRASRPEPAWLVAFRKFFYRFTHTIADWDFIVDMAEFSLFDHRVKQEILRTRSTFPFVRSDLGYVGFKRLGIPYRREERRFGVSHYNLFRMTKFAISGILSSSTFPLRATAYCGLPLMAIDVLAALLSLVTDWTIAWLAWINTAFVVGVISFLALYLARIYKDVVGRPIYIVDWQNSYVNRTDVPAATIAQNMNEADL